MRRRTRESTSTSFDELFPTIAEWVKDFGWIEIGHYDDYSSSFVRVLDQGGMIWESEEELPTVDATLRAAEAHIEEWMIEQGFRKRSRRSRASTESIRKKVDAIRSELGETDYDSQPDWKAVHTALKSLLDAGHADVAVGLGDEILDAGTSDVEHNDQEGEVVEEIQPCLTVVFEAIDQSDLSPAERLEQAVDLESEDEYGLCDDGFDRFWRAERPRSEWQAFAAELEKRLSRPKGGKRGDDFERRYRRDRISDLLAEAMRKAGRTEDASALLEREAVETGSYDRLVDHLVARKRWDDAEAWCRRAVEADKGTLYKVSHWRERIRQIREKRRDWPGVAAIRVEEFIANPGERTFLSLLADAKRAGVLRDIEAWARGFLLTGKLPPKGTSWPLPAADLPRSKVPKPPMASALLEIALAEKKPDEVIRWYDHPGVRGRSPYSADRLDDQVAHAVSRTHPDRAVKIWKRIAEREIATTEVRAYSVAAGYLRSAKEALVRAKRGREWNEYLDRLLEKNRRKTKCVEILKRIGRTAS
jgi:uncharacterized Zn finger protein